MTPEAIKRSAGNVGWPGIVRAMVFREVWRRPAVVLGAWTVAFVAVFVWRGDLGLGGQPEPEVPTLTPPPAPVVVRADRSPRPRADHVVVTGRVFDALGYLVVGAEVVPMQRDVLRTDADGRFQLELDQHACTDVLVRAPGMRATWQRVSAGSPDTLVVRLEPEAPWDAPAPLPAPLPALRGEGTVRGADGQPLANVFVRANGTDLWGRADDFGRFVVPLASAVSTLLVHRSDVGGGGFVGLSAPIPTARARGGLMPLPDVTATVGVAVSGSVRDASGAAIVGVPVRIVGEQLQRTVETGADGAFRVSGLMPGSYRVAPFAFRGGFGRAVDVVLDHEVVACDLHLAAASEGDLRVVDAAGAAVPQAFVAVASDGVRRALAQADAGGHVRVVGGEAADFEVRAPGSFAPMPMVRCDLAEGVLVVATATAGK